MFKLVCNFFVFLTTKVWRTMESAVDEGKVRQLGISNFYSLEDVQWAYDHARIKPKVVRRIFDGFGGSHGNDNLLTRFMLS